MTVVQSAGLQNDRRRELLEHYVQFLGMPKRAWTFGRAPAKAPTPIEVLELPPLSQECDWRYVTVGAGYQPMPGHPDASHRVEYMIYARQSHEALADVLAKLATYPFVNDTFLDVGHTIAGTTGEGVIGDSPLTEFLFTPLFFENDDLKRFQLSGGIHIQLLWAIPIYLSERVYVKEHGWRALVEGPFIDNEIQPADLWRPPAV